MKVELPGSISTFDELPFGAFFMSARNQGWEFGLCVSTPEREKGAIVFPQSPDHSIFLEPANYFSADRTFIHLADAVIRPNLESIDANAGSARLGTLICSDGHYYIRAQTGPEHHLWRSFNVESGQHEDPERAHRVPFFSLERRQ